MSKIYTEKVQVQSQPPPKETALAITTLQSIGIPDDLQRVDVRQLQDTNHYRINVYRTLKDEKSKITDSYYILITPDGIMSQPPMERKYHDDILDAYRS